MLRNCKIGLLTIIVLAGCDRPSPDTIREKQHLPAPGFVANIDDGNRIFHANCARCHGKNALGSKFGPPLIHQVYRPGRHADLTFHWAVKDGAKQHHWQFGNMPAVPNLTPEDVGHVIVYIRTKQREAGIN